MSTATIKQRFTPEEYLAREERAVEKHEYYRGEIFQMSGGTPNHSRIKLALTRLIGTHLLGKPCELFDADMRVKVSGNGLHTYPDASVACPPTEIERIGGTYSLLNPTVIFEVLSPTTMSYDRGAKFNLYSDLTSLKEYFLISQDDALVERRTRTADGHWNVCIAASLEASIRIESIDFDLSLAQLYDNIEFDLNKEEPGHGPTP